MKDMETNTAAIYLRKSTEDDGKSVTQCCETCHLLYNPQDENSCSASTFINNIG